MRICSHNLRSNHKLAAIYAAALLAAPAFGFAQTNATWLGPVNGTWSAGANWSGGVNPTNGGTRYNVFIDAGQAPVVNVQQLGAVTVNNLSISALDQLTLGNASTTNIVGNDVTGLITNAGTISIASTGSNTSLNINGASIGLTGGGTVGLTSAARIAGTGTFNNVDNLIIGNGVVGAGNLNMFNSGTITANAGTITLDPINSGGMVNTGTLSALGSAGTLDISGAGGGSFHGAGTILADGGTVRFISAAIMNGATIISKNGGSVHTTLGISPINLTNINFAADFFVDNGGNVSLSGANTNTGTITVASTGGNTALQVTGGSTITLGGGGTIVLQGTGALLQGGGILHTDNFIRGRGALGSNQGGLVNDGTVSADVFGAKLTVDPINSHGVINNGTLRAENGATLTLSGLGGGTFVNGTGGIISADGASIVEFASAVTVVGGTYVTTNGGGILTTGLTPNTIRGATNNGFITVQNGSALNIGDTITNNGSMTVGSTGGSTGLNAAGGTVTLAGNGIVTLAGAIAFLGGSGTLLTTNTIQGVGAVGLGQIGIRNTGTINAIGGSLIVDPINSASFINTGTVLASTGTAVLSGAGGGDFDSTAGLIRANSTGTISTTSLAVLNAGSVALDGTWQAQGGTLTLGNVSGAGSFNQTSLGTARAASLRIAALSVSAGTVSIALSTAGGSVSKLSTVSVTGGGRFDLADNDLIVTTTPRATVQALIVAARNGGSWNGVGITSSTASAAVPKVTTLGLLSGAEYFSIYNVGATFDGLAIAASDTLVKYTYYGDTDFNGKVDGADYSRIDTAFNSNLLNGGWLNGDLDFNNKVDGADYALIDAAFNGQTGTLRRAVDYLSGDNRSLAGMTGPALETVVRHYSDFGDTYGLAFITSVPEPLACSNLALAAACLLRRRR